MAQTRQKMNARAYYINLSGNDDNTGTQNSPWKTIQKINSIHFNAGDTVLFKAGQTFEGTFFPDLSSQGLFNSPILLSSYGEGMAVINGGNAAAIRIERTKYIVIKKIKAISRQIPIIFFKGKK